MAKRTRPRPKNNLKVSDRIAVPLSTGLTAVIDRPSVNVMRSITLKAEELYPYPEKPVTEELKTLTGDTVQVVGEDEEYQKAKNEAEAERNEYLLEYTFNHRLEIEGYESDESKQELIAQYADERAEIEQFGSIPDDIKDLDAWQFTLRMFIVGDGADYAALMFAVMQAFDQEAIQPDEIRARVRFL